MELAKFGYFRLSRSPFGNRDTIVPASRIKKTLKNEIPEIK